MTTTPAPEPRPATAPLPRTMRAIAHDRYGPADVLGLREVPVPSPGAGEVLVQVRAAGVDRGTWHLVTGTPYLARLAGGGFRRPKQPVPGLDLAGVVAAVGPGVNRFAVGDEVLGIGTGTFAEYAVAKEAKLVPKPTDLAFVPAAALPVSGLTALEAVHDHGRVEAGQRVLILGASGGVGSYAIQLARAAGADVTGVASAAKADLVRRLGAHHVIDYAAADPLDGRVQYDLIVDMGGRHPLRALRRGLTRRGTLVAVGGEGGNRITGGFGRQLRAPLLSPFVPQRLTTFIASEGHEGLTRLVELVTAGDVVPAVERTYDLTEAPDAIRDLGAGRIRGKAVIVV